MNPIEVDGRLNMLTEQRNSAQNHAVLLAGQLAVAQAETASLRERIKDLESKTSSAP